MISQQDTFGANKIARMRATIAADIAAQAAPDLEVPFPYTVITPPIDYFKKFTDNDNPADRDLPPMGW
jgi:hypothetical protein